MNGCDDIFFTILLHMVVGIVGLLTVCYIFILVYSLYRKLIGKPLRWFDWSD